MKINSSSAEASEAQIAQATARINEILTKATDRNMELSHKMIRVNVAEKIDSVEKTDGIDLRA